MTPPPPEPRSLQELHDIVVPDGVPWWPPAPGWFVLAAVVFVAVVWLVVAAVRHHWALRYRRLAMAELRELRSRVREPDARPDCARQAAVLLKRTAIYVHSREQVAALNGGAWLTFLDEHGGDGMFRRTAGSTLIEATYGDAAVLKAEHVGELLDSVERWISEQRVPLSTNGTRSAT